MSGTNIGDELNDAGLSWGWFQGGFRPTTSYAAALGGDRARGPADVHVHPRRVQELRRLPDVAAALLQPGTLRRRHPVGVALGGTGQYGYKDDYIPHHEPFQYYASTANPHHLTIPTDAAGQRHARRPRDDRHRHAVAIVNGVPQFNTPNHNYDIERLRPARGGDRTRRSFRRPRCRPSASSRLPGYEDGHAGYSDPEDEQQFIAHEVNALMQTPDWSSTAVIVNYDDSDGWYDHVYSGVTNPSLSPADNLTNTDDQRVGTRRPGQCGPSPQTTAPLAGEQGRCGFGPRLPMMVISPCAAHNYVDHNLSDQASIINLIEYNWRLPAIPGSSDQALAKHRQLGAHPVRPGRDVRLLELQAAGGDPRPRYR